MSHIYLLFFLMSFLHNWKSILSIDCQDLRTNENHMRHININSSDSNVSNYVREYQFSYSYHQDRLAFVPWHNLSNWLPLCKIFVIPVKYVNEKVNFTKKSSCTEKREFFIRTVLPELFRLSVELEEVCIKVNSPRKNEQNKNVKIRKVE